ncbi:hypothetical protein L7F22_041509 [Adiantum nelumboides]|nr:hypothetical protein [Adiantum nelumboides]
MQEVVGLMKNLGVHMMGGGRGQGYGYGRVYGSNECFVGGRGRGMAGRGDMFQCYNCSEWGHKSPQCDKPKRMGGDMFPLPSQIPSHAQDYGIEIKGEAGPSGLAAEEKGKTKVVNIIRLDKGKDDINAMVMPMGKRTTREQEPSDACPSHKRGKQAETGTDKEKKKRKPRRHYNTSNFPLGEGQSNYNLRADLVARKADVTFGQLMEMCPRLKRQWKRMVNPMKNEPTKGSVRVLSLNKLPNICPTIDSWHKWKCIGETYIDGGAQAMATDQRVRMANTEKIDEKLHMGGHKKDEEQLYGHGGQHGAGMLESMQLRMGWVMETSKCRSLPPTPKRHKAVSCLVYSDEVPPYVEVDVNKLKIGERILMNDLNVDLVSIHQASYVVCEGNGNRSASEANTEKIDEKVHMGGHKKEEEQLYGHGGQHGAGMLESMQLGMGWVMETSICRSLPPTPRRHVWRWTKCRDWLWRTSYSSS